MGLKASSKVRLINGLFLADGNARDFEGSVAITKEEPSVLEFVKKWFNKYNITYRITTKEVKKNDEGLIVGKSTTIIGNSSLWARFLDSFVGTNCYNKNVPNEAYTAPDEFIKGLIMVIFQEMAVLLKMVVLKHHHLLKN